MYKIRLFDRFRKWADSIGINTSKVTMFVELSLKESILDQVEKKDDEKGKEQNAQGLYENRVINEISVNSQEVFYQDAYDRCVKEVSYNTQNKMYNIVHKRMRLYIIIQQKSPETGFFLLNEKFFKKMLT